MKSRGYDREEIECRNAAGDTKFLTRFTIEKGGAARQGYFPVKEDKQVIKKVATEASDIEGQEEMTPEIIDETKPAKGKPGPKSKK